MKISKIHPKIIVGVAILIAVLLPTLLTPWETLIIERQWSLATLPPLATYFVRDLMGERLVVLSRTVVPADGAQSKIVLSPIWLRPSNAEQRLIECNELGWNCQDGKYVLASDPRGVIAWHILFAEFVFPLLIGVGLRYLIKRSEKIGRSQTKA